MTAGAWREAQIDGRDVALAHLGGSETRGLVVLIVPNDEEIPDTGDLEADFSEFVQYGVELARRFLQSDELYSTLPFSIWVLLDRELNGRGLHPCDGGGPPVYREVQPFLEDSRLRAEMLGLSPHATVLSSRTGCGFAMTWGDDIFMTHHPPFISGDVLSHEMGHRLGLADEYPYPPGVDPPCRTEPNNVAIAGQIKWRCLAGALCPVFGTPIHAYSGVQRCGDDVVRPCLTCKMRMRADEFCPVCRAEATFWYAMALGGVDAAEEEAGTSLDIPCLGIDCECGCTPECRAGQECGPDGCFGECGSCADGRCSPDRLQCLAGCSGGEGCYDDLGLEHCEGDYFCGRFPESGCDGQMLFRCMGEGSSHLQRNPDDRRYYCFEDFAECLSTAAERNSE